MEVETVRRRRGRKRATGTRAPVLLTTATNVCLSIHFVHDHLARVRWFLILNIVDEVTKERLAAIAETSIGSRRVARELTTVIARRGRPALIVSDRDTEFTCNAMLSFVNETDLDWHFIALGKPMQNDIGKPKRTFEAYDCWAATAHQPSGSGRPRQVLKFKRPPPKSA